MNASIDIARDLLENPTEELKETLRGSNAEAQEAIQSILPEKSGLDGVLTKAGHANGSSSSNGRVDGRTVEDEAARARLQVVDEDQHFTSKLDEYMRKWELYDAGFDYNVVAVFGSQSTGKSTLLNGVFGTTFDVMSETERRQTTKGIWMCRGQNMKVLVMDVEGTDGRERGEDQDFERKSALFSMATAEVVIVNLWEHQVGLYQGANMGLLKTVLEVNLGLFQAAKAKTKNAHKDKALLLFVIRDHIGATPLANLAATLRQDLNRVWDGLSKPDGLESSQISDFFDMDFTTLPHKLLQPDKFQEEIGQLRIRFIEPKDNKFVFKPAYHKRIPADGFGTYLSSIWEQVVANKDLDLPTQQELLAQFRCDEIANAAFLAFEAQIVAYRKPIDAGSIFEGLGKGMQESRATALTAFDAAASRYHPAVYARKRAELLAKMNASLSPLFVGQLKNLSKSVVKEFKQSMARELKKDGYDFGALVQQANKRAEEHFASQAQLIKLDETDWSYEEAHSQLREELAGLADSLRADETRKMVVVIERNVKRQFAPDVEAALNKPSETMWDAVLKSFREALEKAESSYMKKARSFNCTDEENEHALALLRKRSWLSLRSVIDEQTADSVMLIKLKLAFEDKFRYDEAGVPRVWKAEDDIDGLFKTAKDETLALIPLYAKIAPSEASLLSSFATLLENAALDPQDSAPEDADFDFFDSLSVLSDSKQADLANRFRRESDAYYLETKRSMVSSISQIPVWMYGVMVVLGWNEFIAVIRSPVYFSLLLIALAGAYVIVQLNMVGPVTSLARGVGREVYKVANDTLREHFSAPVQRQMEQPHRAETTRSPAKKSPAVASEPEDIELKKMQ